MLVITPALRLSTLGLCPRRLLRHCCLRLLRLPTPNGLWTTGLSIPIGIRPLACSRLRSACASRRSGAGLSVLPQRPRCRRSPACASLQLAGSSVQDAVLADLIPPVPSETALEAHASRPALPDSPSGSALLHLACALHPWSVRPACLRVCLQLAPLVSAPAPPRARSAYLNSRLAPAVPASRALSNPTDDLLRGHRLLRTLGLPNLCTQVQNQRILWIT